MATTPPAPILPPQIAQQIASAASPAGVVGPGGSASIPNFAMLGRPGQPGLMDPVSALEAKVAELEQWAGEVSRLLNQVQPSLVALLTPIAQAGLALRAELAQMRDRSQAGPKVSGTNVAPPPGVYAGPPVG